MRVRELRLARGWSQAELAERSGLSVRTVQRIENGASPGLESLRSLAAAFDVDIAELQDAAGHRLVNPSFTESVVHTLRHFAEFDGVTGRAEFWWSALAMTLALALAGVVGLQAQVAAAILLFLPMASVTVRRLRDTGESPWWVLIALAPVGGLVALAFLCWRPTATADEVPAATGAEAG